MDREALLSELRQLILTVMPEEGYCGGKAPKVAFSRFDTPQPTRRCFYQPLIALVVQGRKRSIVGNTVADYGNGQSSAVALDLPGIYHITDAAKETPFLSVSLRLDRQVIAELLAASPTLSCPAPETSAEPPSVVVADASEELLEAFIRLVKLEETPERISIFAPMITKEIHYLLLSGPQGACLRHFCANQPQTPRIVRALDWMRTHFSEPLNIPELAERAGMAPSTFHKHFKDLTSLSPIQFQKRLRLHEAERLMFSEGKTVDSAAFAVGYESPSQFSREYKRLFGSAPRQDIKKKKTIGSN